MRKGNIAVLGWASFLVLTISCARANAAEKEVNLTQQLTAVLINGLSSDKVIDSYDCEDMTCYSEHYQTRKVFVQIVRDLTRRGSEGLTLVLDPTLDWFGLYIRYKETVIGDVRGINALSGIILASEFAPGDIELVSESQYEADLDQDGNKSGYVFVNKRLLPSSVPCSGKASLEVYRKAVISLDSNFKTALLNAARAAKTQLSLVEASLKSAKAAAERARELEGEYPK